MCSNRDYHTFGRFISSITNIRTVISRQIRAGGTAVWKGVHLQVGMSVKLVDR